MTPQLIDNLQGKAQEAANLMKTLANPNRLMVLCMLVNQEMCVSELNAKVPLSQSALSQQLAWLRKQDLVATRRQSQTIYYSIKRNEVKLLLNTLHSIYCAE
ncbi:ArsR/SmtB family transcription factor [Catenovulum sediminis]|uniref:Metalloregulator ArsR/SmtB family transcription factor n=1 Tax=Catenovulum sediminis TaxID=1740262 RepID=A0ABV1RN90_9ALTE|nr:metalloregulator ArsR/SmtB family transcription factor [Catenovulum sediminis]